MMVNDASEFDQNIKYRRKLRHATMKSRNLNYVAFHLTQIESSMIVQFLYFSDFGEWL